MLPSARQDAKMELVILLAATAGAIAPLIALVVAVLWLGWQRSQGLGALVGGYCALLWGLALGLVWWGRSVGWSDELLVALIYTSGILAPLAGLILAFAVAEHALLARRIPEGHCQKCGYNLTGNVSGRCPECGTPVGEKASTGGSDTTDA